MAFPTTSVLTNFTGADENPLSEGGNWSGPIRNAQAQAKRLSNAAVHSQTPDATTSGTSYWSAATFGPDLEVFATMPTVPVSAHGVAVWGRIHNPNDAATMEAYLGVYTDGTGWRLFKCLTGGSFTQLGSTTSTPSAVDGEKIGLAITGSTVNLYHFTGGAWNLRVTASDSSITGTGYIGVEFATAATEATLDDFGGGTIVTGGAPLLRPAASALRW